MRSANDNLIVERNRRTKIWQEFSTEYTLQYGDEIVVTQRIITRREQADNIRDGIEQAKKDGKYTGRKPIKVDEEVLRQVKQV